MTSLSFHIDTIKNVSLKDNERTSYPESKENTEIQSNTSNMKNSGNVSIIHENKSPKNISSTVENNTIETDNRKCTDSTDKYN